MQAIQSLIDSNSHKDLKNPEKESKNDFVSKHLLCPIFAFPAFTNPNDFLS